MCIWLLFFSTVVDWRCRTGWFYRAGKCYKFLSHATVPWKTAHDLCQQNRGHLPVITDTELLVRKSLFFNGSYILTSYLKSYACFYPLQPLYFAIFYVYNISLITIKNRNRGFEENEYNIVIIEKQKQRRGPHESRNFFRLRINLVYSINMIKVTDIPMNL